MAQQAAPKPRAALTTFATIRTSYNRAVDGQGLTITADALTSDRSDAFDETIISVVKAARISL